MQKTVQKLKASSLTLSASRLNRSDVARLLLNSDGESVSFFAVVAFLLSLQGTFFVAVVAGAFFFLLSSPGSRCCFCCCPRGTTAKKTRHQQKNTFTDGNVAGARFFAVVGNRGTLTGFLGPRNQNKNKNNKNQRQQKKNETRVPNSDFSSCVESRVSFVCQHIHLLR